MSRILIIEDEEAIAELEKDYLELSGFEVIICNRGDLGLNMALKEDFDLIILDTDLPPPDAFFPVDTGSSTKEFQALQPGHCPIHFEDS